MVTYQGQLEDYLMQLNPMKTKDYVTLGNILGGIASMIASIEGNIDWACSLMVIAWVFDSFDGVVARLTGGGNKFGEVFDNVGDLVSYSMAPSFLIYAAYRTPIELGGPGWPILAAAVLASLPTVFGCIRFARNNVKDIILPDFHLGLPRTVYALYIATLFSSHIFHGPWMDNPSASRIYLFYGLAAAFIALTSWMTLSLRPYYAKPKVGGGAGWFVKFSTGWFLITSLGALIVGLIIGRPRIFLDALFVNFSAYVWVQYYTIPRFRRREVKRYLKELIDDWRAEMG
jgi:CDP-diacylglycerol--serine O-phosphatidyltransferase